MKIKWNYLLIVAGCFALIPPAGAVEKPKNPPLITEWTGPYRDTVILKMADRSDGVVCYIYAPKTVPYSLGRDGVMYGSNNIGSISCVKVDDTKSKSKN